MVSFDDLIPQSTAKKQPKNSYLDSAIRGAGQSYSLGFGDEALAGLMTPVVYGASRVLDVPGFSDKGFSDTYKTLRDKERKQIDEAASDNPNSYYSGMVAGAIASPVKFKGNIASSGLKSGAVYGLGESDSDSIGGMASDTVKGAATGYLAGRALQGAGKLANSAIKGSQNIVKGFNARGVDALESTAGQIDDVASTAFQNMRQSGTVFNKPRIIHITNKVESQLSQDTRLNPRLHGDTMGILDDFKKAAREGDFDFESLHQFRRLFNGVVKKNRINNPDDARLAKIAISTIDDEISKLKPIDVRGGNLKAVGELQTGLKEWSKLRKFETISDIVDKSQGDVNYLKRELTKIANDPKKYGFSGEELAALKDAAKLTTGEAVLKVLGKAGFDPSRLGSGVGAFFGSAAGGVLGGTTGAGIVPVAGTAAKYGQKLLGRGKTERLLNAIETGTYKAPIGAPQIPQGVQSAIGRAGGVLGVEMQPDEAATNQPAPQQPALDFNDLIPSTSPRSEAPQNDVMSRIARVEPGGNPNAKNPNSSASGLFQFTNDTWNSSVQRWGKELGITHKDKNNPQAQEAMARKLADSNAQYIKKNLGVEPDDGQIYLAHFMGAPAAVKLMKNYGKRASAAQMFPKEAKANQSIFFDANGRARTIEQVYDIVTNKVRVG